MLDNNYIKVKDHEDLVKDPRGNSILNADVDAFELFKARKRKEKATEDRLTTIEGNIDNILNSLNSLSKLIQENYNVKT